MITCPNCGSNPRFDIESQKVVCSFCGSSFEPTDERLETSQFPKESELMEVKVFTCTQCGGELFSTATDATAFCSYCGSHQVLMERLDRKERPKQIIPFQITKDQCRRIYGSKMRRQIFAPRSLKDPAHIDEFRGIYMPYWSYDFTQKGRISINGKKEHREGDYRIVEHFDLSVDADNYYRGISHDASSSFADNISESLAPFDTRKATDFGTPYLSGFYADIPDTKSELYEEEAAQIAAEDCFDEAMRTPEFHRYDVSQISDGAKKNITHTKCRETVPALFPVWFLSYRKGDRIAYTAINGQTGKMTADVPVDGIKYLIGTAILTLLIWGLLELFNISSLRQIVSAVFYAAIAGWLLYAMVLNHLKSREAFLRWETETAAAAPEDLTAPQEEGTKKKKKKKKKTAEKPGEGISVIWVFVILGIIVLAGFLLSLFGLSFLMLAVPVILAVYTWNALGELQYRRGKASTLVLTIVMEFSVIIWLLNPYKDPIYYACCLMMTAGVIWSFFDALYYYNQLMTRPMPQFQKRGGDDRG